MPSHDTFRIIHCSDPHWGRQFNEEIWKDFTAKAVEKRPHLLLITGDCVDNPWRWTLQAAKKDINLLEQQINADRPERDRCYIRMVPGNHDVRITGLIPVRPWLTISIVALVIGVLAFWALSVWLALLVTLGAVFLLVLLHNYYIGHFNVLFCERLKRNPERFSANNIGVELYYFDSASNDNYPFSADGTIRTADFVTATKAPCLYPPPAPGEIARADSIATASSPATPTSPPSLAYRIAMTHHHPIGVPHDHRHEPLMIMRNAGAFLSELAAQRIRLVLHGHKHHPHFSRLTVNAERPEEFQIGVLGAGTVTRGKPSPEPQGFHFYYLELDANLNMQATSYVSRGGAFHSQPSFYIEDIREAIRRQRVFAESQYGMSTELLKGVTTVFPDGDTRERIEYHRFRVTSSNERYTQLPRPSHACVDRGHIEGFIAGPLDSKCPPSLYLRPDPDTVRFKLQKQYGQVEFGSAIYAQTPPFSFFTQFHALNSLAMSVQQHEERYGFNPQPRSEMTTLVTPVWPVDKLEMVIEFPPSFAIAGDPELTVENAYSQRLNIIEREYRPSLIYDPVANIVRLSVNTPPPDTSFIIRWGLRHVEPPEARAIASLSGETKQLQRTLLDLAWGKDRSGPNEKWWANFQQVTQMAENLIRDELEMGSAEHDPLDVSLMVYDQEQGRWLRIIGGNYPVTDERATKTLAYGDGIAGRCHKANSMRLFVKAYNHQTRLPYGYLPWTDYPSPAGIPHEVLFCLPLTNPDEQSLLYGVLNIGSLRADSKLLMLQKRADESSQETDERDKLFHLLTMGCYAELAKTIQDPSLTASTHGVTVTPEVRS